MAGPSWSSPSQRPVTIRTESEEGRIQNLSTGFKKPLYRSCNEDYHNRNSRCSSVDVNEIGQDLDSILRTGRPRFLTLNTLPRIPATSPVFQRPPTMTSPFLQLPTEIRLQIYSLLVLPRKPNDLLPSFEKVSSSTQDYFDYDKKKHGTDRPITTDLTNPTLHIRTVDPTRYQARYPKNPRHFRSSYSVRADRFRARCMETTYHCVNNPRIEDNLAILRTNKQIHAEAAELMYSSYTFDFDTHIESIIPFLSDLTPFARSCIKSVRIVKRALPYLKEFDKCEWHNALRYLTSSANNISLRRLELGVVAGRPGEKGWERVPRYSKGDFELLSQQDGMEWMQYLFEVDGLQELDVQAVIEHCPPTTSSSAMANYVRFSASVETGFADYLREHMLRETQMSGL